MYRFETIDLGEYRGRTYFLTGFVEPEPDNDSDPDADADRYGVAVARAGRRPFEDNVEIVRMDNAHGHPHLDREYLSPDSDENEKVWLDDGYTDERMKQYLLVNWERFAELSIRFDESESR